MGELEFILKGNGFILKKHHLSNNEIQQIEQEFDADEKGTFKQIEYDIGMFIRHNISEINNYFKENIKKNSRLNKEIVFGGYIIKNKSVNPVRDIKDQSIAIEEKARQEEKRQHRKVDREEIARNWDNERWREHKILEVLYVFSKYKENYLCYIDNLSKI